MTSRSLQLLRTFTRTSVSTTAFTPSGPTITTIKRNFSRSSAIMGVTKTVLKEGTGRVPVNGDQVTIEYTGFLKDTTKPDNKGAKFDSSVDRGPFVVSIGVGQVIRGWDEGVTTMKQGEKATLDITSDFGYGNRGFPGVIPAGSDLIFDVELLKVGK